MDQSESDWSIVRLHPHDCIRRSTSKSLLRNDCNFNSMEYLCEFIHLSVAVHWRNSIGKTDPICVETSTCREPEQWTVNGVNNCTIDVNNDQWCSVIFRIRRNWNSPCWFAHFFFLRGSCFGTCSPTCPVTKQWWSRNKWTHENKSFRTIINPFLQLVRFYR